MTKKGMTISLILLMFIFYCAIIMYVFFEVQNIDAVDNWIVSLIFEIIGFLFLGGYIIGHVVRGSIKTGYIVPLVFVTIIYTIILNVVNLICIFQVNNHMFVLMNLILLFVYLLISLPMYIIGRK